MTKLTEANKEKKLKKAAKLIKNREKHKKLGEQ